MQPLLLLLNITVTERDVQSFLKKFRTDIDSSTTFSLETLDGGSNPQGSSQAGVEAVSVYSRSRP